MARIRAVVFDFIGTLTGIKDYSMEDSKTKLYEALVAAGFDVESAQFMHAHDAAHEKYRLVRYGELKEVTNAVWVSEALNALGFKTSPESSSVKSALNIFFEDYLQAFELRPCVKRLLTELSADYKLGLVSNFTYAPVIYSALRRLGINGFFNAVLVSEAVVWRKPHEKIFEEVLKRLGASGEEAVYVGDSPLEDIKGAKTLGMKTIFVPSQFYTMESLRASQQQPDMIAEDICRLRQKFSGFLKTLPT